MTTRITEAEIAELERRVAHAPARPNYIELNYCYAMLRRLLSERREREGKLTLLEMDHCPACGFPDAASQSWMLRAEEAGAKLARVDKAAQDFIAAAVALAAYRDHHRGCEIDQTDVCNCGLRVAMKACDATVTKLRQALADPPRTAKEEPPRVNDERAKLEYLAKLTERWGLGELSAEDYHAAVKEIFTKRSKKLLDN